MTLVPHIVVRSRRHSYTMSNVICINIIFPLFKESKTSHFFSTNELSLSLSPIWSRLQMHILPPCLILCHQIASLNNPRACPLATSKSISGLETPHRVLLTAMEPVSPSVIQLFYLRAANKSSSQLELCVKRKERKNPE